MVEIAISLAIIGFALVAIIGVLPAGMSVQKDNREQTIINLDAAFLMDAIRNGPLGQDDLTNYVVSIGQTNVQFGGNRTLQIFQTNINLFTNLTFIKGNSFGPSLTNGFNIIGLLSTPKYVTVVTPEIAPQPPFVTLWSNTTTAVFRAINAPAVDQGQSQASRDFAFQYQVTIEIVPSAEYPFPAVNGTWFNLTTPVISNNPVNSTPAEFLAQNLQGNLYDIRLTLRWPVLPNGQIGGGKQVFRSSVAGTYRTNSPALPLNASYQLANGAYLYFMQPEVYTAQTP